MTEIPNHVSIYKDTPIMGYSQKQIKEKGKWQTICQKCKYRNSSFMPCNACDDLGSQFEKENG